MISHSSCTACVQLPHFRHQRLTIAFNRAEHARIFFCFCPYVVLSAFSPEKDLVSFLFEAEQTQPFFSENESLKYIYESACKVMCVKSKKKSDTSSDFVCRRLETKKDKICNMPHHHWAAHRWCKSRSFALLLIPPPHLPLDSLVGAAWALYSTCVSMADSTTSTATAID